MTNDKLKRFANKKIVLGGMAMLFGIVIIFVCSIVPVIIDPSRWGSTEFISDETIICALTIFGEIAMVMVGQPYNAGIPESNIARARVKFNESVKENITNLCGFYQWIKKVLQVNDQKEKYHTILETEGITNYKILELERNELKELVKAPQKYNGMFFKQITKKQYKTIIDILDGKHKIDFVAPQNYITNKCFDNSKTVSEKMSNQQKKKAYVLTLSILSKTLLTLAVGLIFGALMRDVTAQIKPDEVIVKLVVRLFAFSSSGFMGFIVGVQINDIDAEYVEEKTRVHQLFKDDKDFKPLTEEEEAKQEFIARVKTENLLENNSNKLEVKL